MKKYIPLSLGCILALNQAFCQNPLDKYQSGTPTQKLVADAADGVSLPRDLDFDPATNALWVINKGGTATTNGAGKWVVFKNPLQDNPTSEVKTDGQGGHFFNTPSAISFGTNGNCASSSEIINSPGDTKEFMGPALWKASIIGGNNQHIDMLHQSPFSMGIEHEKDNIYWVFDGHHENLCKYNFNTPHSPGAHDHQDGEIAVFAEVKLLRKPGVPSHLVRDKTSNYLYVVDTGNKRILRVDATSGAKGTTMSQNDGLGSGKYYNIKDAKFQTIISSGLVEPSGIDFLNDRLVISDHNNGDIVIYNTSGTMPTEVSRIKTGTPGIMGVKIGPDGKIWYVNYKENKVIRLEPGLTTNLEHEQISSSLEVFPNPSNGEFNVKYNLNNASSVNINVLDGKGTILKSFKFQGSIGDNISSISLLDQPFAKGIYFAKITVGENHYFKKISIQ